MSGNLVKMKIEGFADVACTSPTGSFTVMFNPASFSQRYEVNYKEEQAPGTTGTVKTYNLVKPQEYGFEFLLDGTGASAPKIDVARAVADFVALTGELKGETHRPNFLKLSWGTLLVKCVLKTADVTYNLFKPNGFPLRAKIKAVFSVHVDESLRVARENKSSPDLTHYRSVVQGDNLPLMTARIYGDPALYAAVARYNRMNHFRDLQPGARIQFPPLADLAPFLPGEGEL